MIKKKALRKIKKRTVKKVIVEEPQNSSNSLLRPIVAMMLSIVGALAMIPLNFEMTEITAFLEMLLMEIGIVGAQTFWGSDAIVDRLQFPETQEQIAMVSGIAMFILFVMVFTVKSIAKLFWIYTVDSEC